MKKFYFVRTNADDVILSVTDDVIRYFNECDFPAEWTELAPTEMLQAVEDDSSWEIMGECDPDFNINAFDIAELGEILAEIEVYIM